MEEGKCIKRRDFLKRRNTDFGSISNKRRATATLPRSVRGLQLLRAAAREALQPLRPEVMKALLPRVAGARDAMISSS